MGKIGMIQRNSQKVFRSCPRGRKIMVVGGQDYTIPGSGSFQPFYAACSVFPGALCRESVSWKIARAANCRDQKKRARLGNIKSDGGQRAEFFLAPVTW